MIFFRILTGAFRNYLALPRGNPRSIYMWGQISFFGLAIGKILIFVYNYKILNPLDLKIQPPQDAKYAFFPRKKKSQVL